MGGRKGTPIFGRAKAREGLDYTERQLSILCDDVPLSAVSLNELSNIMKKANARCDNYNYEIAKLMYEAKYSLQGTTQGNGLTGGLPPVRFSM